MAPGFTEAKMHFAARLKLARKKANISQERAAAAVGTSRRHWIRWESGETTPNPAYLERIAEVLDDPSLTERDDDDEEESDLAAFLISALRSYQQTAKVGAKA